MVLSTTEATMTRRLIPAALRQQEAQPTILSRKCLSKRSSLRKPDILNTTTSNLILISQSNVTSTDIEKKGEITSGTK